MLQVEIRGKITNEKHDKILWENKVEIVEILKCSTWFEGRKKYHKIRK